MPAIRHIHTYKRNKKLPNIYQCAHPECSHYVDKKWLVGKKSMCTCGNEFILTTVKLRNAQPRCDLCSSSRRSRDFQKAAGIMDLILENAQVRKKEEEIKDESISVDTGD